MRDATFDRIANRVVELETEVSRLRAALAKAREAYQSELAMFEPVLAEERNYSARLQAALRERDGLLRRWQDWWGRANTNDGVGLSGDTRLVLADASGESPLLSPVAPPATEVSDAVDPLPPDGGFTSAGGATPVLSGSDERGLLVGGEVSLDGSHTPMSSQSADSYQSDGESSSLTTTPGEPYPTNAAEQGNEDSVIQETER